MHAIIYRFTVKPGEGQSFIDAWSALTEWIQVNRASLGSRLHQESSNTYVAYAQWPSKAVFDKEWDQTESYQALAKTMRTHCAHIETVFAMDEVADLLIREGS